MNQCKSTNKVNKILKWNTKNVKHFSVSQRTKNGNSTMIYNITGWVIDFFFNWIKFLLIEKKFPPIFDRAYAYAIIPLMLWKVTNILTYLYKYSVKINRFCSKNDWFLMILAIFYQKFLPKYTFWSVRPKELCSFLLIACSKFTPKSIHQIAWFQLQKYRISQLLRGHIPPHPLCTQVYNLRWCTTKSSPPQMTKMDLHPWWPMECCGGL